MSGIMIFDIPSGRNVLMYPKQGSENHVTGTGQLRNVLTGSLKRNGVSKRQLGENEKPEVEGCLHHLDDLRLLYLNRIDTLDDVITNYPTYVRPNDKLLIALLLQCTHSLTHKCTHSKSGQHTRHTQHTTQPTNSDKMSQNFKASS